MRVALVHDWLTGMRGGEKVLEEVCLFFPQADLFTLLHVPGSVSASIEDRMIYTSPLQKVPGVRRTYRSFLPFFPNLIERFDLSAYDFVLSTSSCVAKGARPGVGARHVSYVFSPMRYVWDRFDDYFGPGRASPPARATMRICREPLRRWDRDSSRRVHQFVADSKFVAGRIRDYYDRDSIVIPPPVDV
ncbi:MAG TPA: glycosyltransferase family 4 protein, partial [bacterium]|nr:glycosyltransferase family 4 protein [bacterium]